MHINSTIGLHKIKYAVLNQILEFKSTTEQINFYIDGHMLVDFLYRENIQTEFLNSQITPVKSVLSITNSFLAIVEHYRKYLYKKGYNTNFYILFNRKLPSYQNSIIPFGNNFYDRYHIRNEKYNVINGIIEKSVEFLIETCKYIPHVYMVDNEAVDDTFTMKYIINKTESEKTEHLIFTKNKFMYQLVDKGVSVLRPKRDDSYVIDIVNFWDKLTLDYSYDVKYIDYTFYQYVLIVNGYTKYDVIPINSSFIKLLKLFDRLVKEEILDNGMSSKSFIDIFNDFTLGGEPNHNLLSDRYKAIIAKNPEVIGKSTMHNIDYSLSYDIYDMNSLEELNKLLPDEDKLNIYSLYDSRVGKKKLRW